MSGLARTFNGATVGRRGAVLVIFAAGLLSFMGMLALVVDVGFAYTMQTRFQAVADAAALSAMAAIDPGRPVPDQAPLAEGVARATLRANGLNASAYTISVRVSQGSVPTCSIAGTETIDMFFARAFGHAQWSIRVATQAMGERNQSKSFVGRIVG